MNRPIVFEGPLVENQGGLSPEEELSDKQVGVLLGDTTKPVLAQDFQVFCLQNCAAGQRFHVVLIPAEPAERRGMLRVIQAYLRLCQRKAPMPCGFISQAAQLLREARRKP